MFIVVFSSSSRFQQIPTTQFGSQWSWIFCQTNQAKAAKLAALVWFNRRFENHWFRAAWGWLGSRGLITLYLLLSRSTANSRLPNWQQGRIFTNPLPRERWLLLIFPLDGQYRHLWMDLTNWLTLNWPQIDCDRQAMVNGVGVITEVWNSVTLRGNNHKDDPVYTWWINTRLITAVKSLQTWLWLRNKW